MKKIGRDHSPLDMAVKMRKCIFPFPAGGERVRLGDGAQKAGAAKAKRPSLWSIGDVEKMRKRIWSSAARRLPPFFTS